MHQRNLSSAATAALLLTVSGLGGCVTSQPGAATHDGRNNVVTSQTQNVTGNAENDRSKLLVQGENNLIEVKDRNSSYTSRDDQSVTIVQGSNNHLTFDQEGNRSVSEHRRDTLIFRADGMRGAYSAKNQASTTRNTTGTTIIGPAAPVASAPAGATPPDAAKTDLTPTGKTGKPAPPAPDRGAAAGLSRVALAEEPAVKLGADLAALTAAAESVELVLVPALNKLVPVTEAADYYRQQAEAGHVDAFFQLGKLFQAEHGGIVDLKRALNYYEVAARHNHGAAALAPAQLYEAGVEVGGSFEVEPDARKAQYYYALAEKNGAKRPAAKPLGRW